MKFFCTCVLILCILIFASHSVRAEEVSVRPAEQELIETGPREVVTTTLRVTNNTEKRREFAAQVMLPERWQLITTEFPFELGRGESDIRLLSFFVPLKTPAGSYTVTYIVRDKDNPSISGQYSISVVVVPVARLNVRLLEQPEYVIAGEDYSLSFVISNNSNTKTRIELKVESSYPFEIDTQQFLLGMGESKTVNIMIKTDKELNRKMKHRVRLTARALDLEKGKLTATSSSWVDIIPKVMGVYDSYHRLPVKINLRNIMEKEDGERKHHLQMEISGSGTLTEKRKKHVSFFLRGPNISNDSTLRQHDEYRFSFWTKTYGIHLGDRSYSLSPLTESSFYGRGAEGSINAGNFTFKTFHTKSRFAEPEKERTAAYFGYHIDDDNEMGINILKKEENSEEKIYSLRGLLKPHKNINLDLEYARDEDDKACRGEVLGHVNKALYNLRYIHAGPHYSGAYKDMEYKSGSIIVPVWKNLRLNATYRQERHNLNLDPTLSSASKEDFYKLGSSYLFKTGTNLSLSYENRKRKDLLPEPDFDYVEETCRLGLSQSFQRLSFYSSVDWGKRKDNLSGETSDLKRYLFSAFARPFDRIPISIYSQYSDDNNGKRRMTAGINGSFNIERGTSLSFNLKTDKYRESIKDRYQADVRLKHRMFKNCDISVHGRHISYKDPSRKDETDIVLGLGYSIPFGIPLSRKMGVATLRGKIYDIQKKEGIARVIVRLNEKTAVTDKGGAFIFPCLKPGSYWLSVDKASIGLNKVTVQKTPMKITLGEGEESCVEIGIVQSANVCGQVIVYDFVEKKLGEKKIVESGKLEGTYVEITNGKERYLRVTDEKGCFQFEDLRPAKWTLKIYSDNLPMYHYLKRDTFKFELKPGDKKEIIAKVLPEEHHIKIIEEGEVLEEE